MVIGSVSVSSTTLPADGINHFTISSKQLFKGLYLESLGRQCQMVLPAGQNLVVTDLESSEIQQGSISDSLVIKTNRLPPGCEILIRGKNFQIKRIDHLKNGIEILSSSPLQIGITSNIEEFTTKTGKKGASDLMTAIQAL